MKKGIFAALLAFGLLAGPAIAANDHVFVVYEGNKERLRNLDLEAMSVCALKSRAAAMFGLSVRRFDLRLNGRKLDDRRTLAEDNIYSGRTISVVPVGSTTQC